MDFFSLPVYLKQLLKQININVKPTGGKKNKPSNLTACLEQ